METAADTLLTELDRLYHSRLLEGTHHFQSDVLNIVTCAGRTDAKDWKGILAHMYTRGEHYFRFYLSVMNNPEEEETASKRSACKCTESAHAALQWRASDRPAGADPPVQRAQEAADLCRGSIRGGSCMY